jgi:hypothetical protein
MTEPAFIENDPPIVGQNFVLLSFISPEKIIKQKDRYLFMRFLRDVFAAPADDPEYRTLYEMRQRFGQPDLSYETVNAAYSDWAFKFEDVIGRQFDQENQGLTSVRCVKIRGVYDLEAEADARARQMQRRDPAFSVYKARVGYWLPWEPDTAKITDVQYLEDGMQTLHNKYHENQRARDEFFEQEKREAREREARERQAAGVSSVDPEQARAAIQDLREIANLKEAQHDVTKALTEADPWSQRRGAAAGQEVASSSS